MCAPLHSPSLSSRCWIYKNPLWGARGVVAREAAVSHPSSGWLCLEALGKKKLSGEVGLGRDRCRHPPLVHPLQQLWNLTSARRLDYTLERVRNHKPQAIRIITTTSAATFLSCDKQVGKTRWLINVQTHLCNIRKTHKCQSMFIYIVLRMESATGPHHIFFLHDSYTIKLYLAWVDCVFFEWRRFYIFFQLFVCVSIVSVETPTPLDRSCSLQCRIYLVF